MTPSLMDVNWGIPGLPGFSGETLYNYIMQSFFTNKAKYRYIEYNVSTMSAKFNIFLINNFNGI